MMASVAVPAHSGDLDVLGDFLEPSMDLLKFYRSKISGFEAERAEFLSRLADVEVRMTCTLLELQADELTKAYSRMRRYVLLALFILQAQNGEMHRLRWELRAREDEVSNFARFHLPLSSDNDPVGNETVGLKSRELLLVVANFAACRSKSCRRQSATASCFCMMNASRFYGFRRKMTT